MTRRTFKISQATQRAGLGVMDIPTLAVFRSQTVRQLIEAFEEKWGSSPAFMAIPVNEEDGLLFDVDGLRDVRRSAAADVSRELAGFADVVSAIASEGVGIILIVNPSLSFLNVSALQLVNIAGTSASQVCIGQSKAQDMLAAILGTGLDIALEVTSKKSGKVFGVAIDGSDLWPMGTSGPRIEPHCFCGSCVDYFEAVAPGMIKRFRTFPSPWNLVLRGSTGGINFVSDFGPRSSADDIIGLSKRQGFDDIFEGFSNADLSDTASQLLRYVRARHDLTVASMQSIFTQAKDGLAEDQTPRSIAIVEGAEYGWTTGMWIQDLNQTATSPNPPFDEVWFNGDAQVPAFDQGQYRTYMARRGRYLVSDFFQLCASASDTNARSVSGIARLTQEKVRSQIQIRADRTLGTLLDGQALAALPDDLSSLDNGDHGGRLGFVAPGIALEFMEKYIAQLRIVPGLADREEMQGKSVPDLVRMLESIRGLQLPEVENQRGE